VIFARPWSKLVGFGHVFLNFILLTAPANAQHTVNLTWDASASQIIGYNIYRGNSPNPPYKKLNSAPNVPTNYSDTTAQGGHTYYYAATSVAQDGTESKYSNLGTATIPVGGAGTENALYSFTGSGGDPKLPYAGLVFDAAGNIYGTTELGGTYNQGTVFEVVPSSDGTWTESVLYNFTGDTDGGQPNGSLIFDAAGNLYGTTSFGGSSNCTQGCGTVFKLTPASGGWSESVLYTFTGGADGREPYSRLQFDAAGNLYGTTLLGGNIGTVCTTGCGTVFELKPSSGKTWKQSVLYAFAGAADGAMPTAALTFDTAYNLYGTASAGGSGSGVIYKLTPGSGGTWKQSVLHTFSGGYDGKTPYGDLILGASGNLYGTAYQGGVAPGYGVVFQLSLTSKGWRERLLHVFYNAPAASPVAGLVMDPTGSLFGTTMLGATRTACGGGCGNLFKLAPSSGGGWTYSLIHTFGKNSDGHRPTGDLILDTVGNIYGTTQAGGINGAGMVFQILH
jgi:uncharacterized repeat protein (TIGR03803 family)